MPFTRAHYDAILCNNNQGLGQLLAINTPTSWTEFADAVSALPVLIAFFEKLNGDERWGSYFIVNTIENELVGTAGYKGAADENGYVELGYEIRAAHQNKGYATEAANGLIIFAKSQPEIKGVRAHTLPEENFSVKVLRKCGMKYKATVVDPEDGEVWRWEIVNRAKK